MERFIRRENIKHYQDVLEHATDETERRRIQKLLDEELLKQKTAADEEPKIKRS